MKKHEWIVYENSSKRRGCRAWGVGGVKGPFAKSAAAAIKKVKALGWRFSPTYGWRQRKGAPDWRIGQKVRPRLSGEPLSGQVGTVVSVRPDGFEGVINFAGPPTGIGILVVRMQKKGELTVIVPARFWETI